MTISKRCLHIIRINLQHNFIPNFLLACLIILATPLIFGIGNLDSTAVWTPLEMFASLIGIVLLVPIFTPELDNQIEDVVGSKYTNIIQVYLLRAICAFAVIILLAVILCLCMNVCSSDATLLHVMGTIANAVFLGSLGTFALAVIHNVTIGYMVPIIYYAINYTGGEYLGNFYLFSGISGNYQEKMWLFCGGILLIGLSLTIKYLIQKRR